MGFGLFLIGYAAAYPMSLNSFGFLLRLIGSAVMLSGTSRLLKFEKNFYRVHLSCILLAVASVAESALCILADFTSAVLPFNIETAASAALGAFLLLSVPMHLLFYRAVRTLSADVGLGGIRARSVKYEIFFGVGLLLVAATYITYLLRARITNYFYVSAVIFLFVVAVLTLTLIYSCYKDICEEGDEDAPRKPSKIPFLNTLFEASEKREREIYEKTKAYAEEKVKQDLEKKRKKKKKKRGK